MKSKGLRGQSNVFDSEDTIRKAVKLDPIRKSGKDKNSYRNRFDDEDDEDLELMSIRKRESVLDYYDDGPDDDIYEDDDDDDGFGDDDEYDEEDED